jgi:hypothetical protein
MLLGVIVFSWVASSVGTVAFLLPTAAGTIDAAEFAIATACSFASARFNARISPNAGG